MKLLRTPDHRFADLPDYPFTPRYLDIPYEGQTLRMHYLDEGDRAGEVVVLLHGQPSWSYLYRKVIPYLTAAGLRVIAPDLIGFGRSDKPSRIADFTYRRQEEWLHTALFDVLGLRDVTLYAQDWGGLLSLRIVAFHPEYFRRVMIANTGLPVGGRDSNFLPGDEPRRLGVTLGGRLWQLFARHSPVFPIGRMAQALASESTLTPGERRAYDAPFPERSLMAAPRAMPSLIPFDADSPASRRSREAWARLADFDKPFRTAFSDEDFAIRMISVTDARIQAHVAGARAQRHVRIADAGHFLQEDQPRRVAEELLALVRENP